MLGYLEGEIKFKYEDHILLLVNQVGYEILIPAFVMDSLQTKKIGDKISLFIYYHQTERQPKPILIGFILEMEKNFFQYFISVEAIGPLKAVKALNIPIHEIANYIETGDTTKLKQLNGIGNRTAQKIIATLKGKVKKFIINETRKIKKTPVLENISNQVFEVLVTQLGHKPDEAKQLIDDAFERNHLINTPDKLFDEIYRGTKE